jgi:dephospho-CoA kinase
MGSAATALLKVGLTGGIASGKTTVADHLERLGAFVIRADEIAHRIIEPGGPAHAAVVERFGSEILDDARRIVRPRLARIVFGDAAALAALNAIVHPEVRRESERLMRQCATEDRSWLAVYDAALLVETGYHRQLDRLIVVSCSPATQLRRLRERDGMSEVEARRRVESQAPLDEKLAAADYVIDTDGSMERTLSRTERVFEFLRETWQQYD